MSFPAKARSRLLWITVVIVAVVSAFLVVSMSRRTGHPLLTSPTLLIDNLPGGSLYWNAQAFPWLAQLRPDLLTPEDRDAKSAKARGMVQAVQNPKLFRQLDRQYRFDTLLLIGDPSQYRPLLDHLVEAKDFALTYVDHAGYIYQRKSGQWSVDQLTPLREELKTADSEDQVRFLSQTAGKLIAVRQTAAARELLTDARALDESVADLWGAEAQYQLAIGRWKDAIAAADRALAIDDEWQPALACKAQALYSTKRFAEAYPVSQALMSKNPEDPGLLFYHAKIAHEARAFMDEIRTMKKLIELAEREQRPTSGYRVYLAQAYASAGDGEPAIEQFRMAMEDPDLPKDQRQFAIDTTAQIKSRLGLR